MIEIQCAQMRCREGLKPFDAMVCAVQ